MGAERCRVDIDADQAAGEAERLLPGIRGRELRPQNQDHIGRLRQTPARNGRESRAGMEAVIVGNDALAGDGGEDRRADALGDRQGGRAAIDGAAPQDQDGLLGLAEQRRGACQGGRMDAIGRRSVGKGRHLLPRGLYRHHVEGQGDMDRTGTALAEEGEGLREQCRQILWCGDRGAEAREAAHGLGLVGQLMDMPLGNARERQAPDAGDHQHGDGIRKGLGDGRRRVQQPRPGDEKTDARPARCPGIAIGHEARALLVARLDMADAASRQAAVKLKGMRARNAEHGVDVILLQQSYQRLAAAERFDHDPPPSSPSPSRLGSRGRWTGPAAPSI